MTNAMVKSKFPRNVGTGPFVPDYYVPRSSRPRLFSPVIFCPIFFVPKLFCPMFCMSLVLSSPVFKGHLLYFFLSLLHNIPTAPHCGRTPPRTPTASPLPCIRGSYLPISVGAYLYRDTSFASPA